ncbi:hypothetical protein ACJIZ3_011457 [Penstemon smallii]|uniref:PHD-type domain-containing protein n=1 Tax=Penstemon smallii TaxID=265156 RepID=A0ABD3UJK8_9LAMI
MNQDNNNPQDLGSREIVVSSIRAGMKREFAMMMRAQSDMGELSVGRRRLTRSQNVGSSIKENVGSAGKVGKKVKNTDARRIEKTEGEEVGKLEVVGNNIGDELRGSKDETVASEEGGLKRVRANLVEVVVTSVLPQVGGNDVEREDDETSGGASDLGCQRIGEATIELAEKPLRRYTRLSFKQHDEAMKLAESGGEAKIAKNVKDAYSGRMKQTEGEGLGKLEVVEPSIVAELIDLDVESIEIEKGGLERERADLREVVVTESPLPQVVGNDVELEDDKTVGGASNLGCVSIGEATSELAEKPFRRYTRSALKLQDEAMESESSPRVTENGVEATSTCSPSKLEMKMSKKVSLKKVPTKLKDLLETGLLEGLNVRYIRGSKQSELRGVIRRAGILCSCKICQGEKVLTPNQFELHAESGNKRPPEYIYLENGKSLRDVLNACKVAHSDSLEMIIQNAIGRSDSSVTAFCLNCKGLIPEAGAGRAMLLCNSCVTKESESISAKISDTPSRSLLGDSSAVASTIQPQVPKSAQVSLNSKSQPHMKPKGRLTKKDLGMHRIVLTDDFLPDGAALYYVMQGKKRLEGFKENGGIHCSCCDDVVSPSQFEAHAGFASRRKPYDNIFTSNGLSLHKLALELSTNRKLSPEQNDDLCSICEDGGDLLCCEKCPRAFHPECVDLSDIPKGTWYCRYCQNMIEKSKFEERSANAIAAGRVAGVDPVEEITKRCIRIVKTFESEVGGCAICRGLDFTKEVFDDHTVIICDQCEKEYHVGCLREQNMDNLKAVPKDSWFCCIQCNEINSALQKLIDDGEQRLPEFLSSILKTKYEEQGSGPDIKWRLLRGREAPIAMRKPLSAAVSVFHEQFQPIADSSTQNADLIPDMVYGRAIKNGPDYGGMYCAILMVNSVVVSAAIFRTFGEEVAELPLVATRSEYQGKGYFQSLFYCIENLLLSFNVKDLVLPAADEAQLLWKNKFGFEELEEEQVDQYKKEHHQMMIFKETLVLHKPLSAESTNEPEAEESN